MPSRQSQKEPRRRRAGPIAIDVSDMSGSVEDGRHTPPDQPDPAAKPARRPRRETTARQLAESLKLSVATVSRALNNHPEVSDETRRRVHEAALAAGYAPSVGKRPGNVLALLFPDEQPAEFGGFEASIMSGILRVARENNFDVAIVNPAREKHPVESYTQFFQRRGISGALLRGTEGLEAADELAKEGFPSIVIAGRPETDGVSYVDADSRHTSRLAVEHLIALGHKRIGLGTHVIEDADHIDRRLGYTDALTAAGITVDEDLIVRTPVDQRGGVIMLERLLSLPDPATAIYFTNPLPTIGALLRCARLSIRVPEELSIIGFDDTDVRHRTFPAFTAVTQDASDIAVEATRWLIARIDGRATGFHRVLRDTEFHVEESTALPPTTPIRLKPGGIVVRARA